MHSDVQESIGFKLGIMIHAIKLYIFIPVQLALTLIQCHMSARKQKPCGNYFKKVFFFHQFGWSVVYSWDLLVWRILAHFIPPISYSREKTHMWFRFRNKTKQNTKKLGLYSYIYWPISLKLGMVIGTFIFVSVSSFLYQSGWPWPPFNVCLSLCLFILSADLGVWLSLRLFLSLSVSQPVCFFSWPWSLAAFQP